MSGNPDPEDNRSHIEGEVFHAGERAVQTLFGVRSRVAENGARAIRPFITEQQGAFLGGLRYVLIGTHDLAGSLWPTVLFGAPGFIVPIGPASLEIRTGLDRGDPAVAELVPGRFLGVLGIDLAERRRVRMNGRLVEGGDDVIRVEVDQAFNNCPQYIWPRCLPHLQQSAPISLPSKPKSLEFVDAEIGRIIRGADTFFIASRHSGDAEPRFNGVDISHRGGRPGFLEICDNTIVWPEYTGNSYFNTLGNLLFDASCGLLVPDFENGRLLQLSGRAEILWPSPLGSEPREDGPQINCRVRFRPSEIFLRTNALAGAWRLLGRAQFKAGQL
ncbi:pyridoxamine 5'-phosphate oxidase family protein [Telmatospirillum siberiense]|uniref:Flavin-nucleotide-binding protein n=1 Tax=Telmatospirillum siberiense TaxID=382514 RepID=A0A2N3PNV4_9PROT|nr:pyridoxamine 5'-phosphate oxidase family protein [Telmatospirillum siberiense]PKU22093.1 flavin-nucleotide-binding protein [Telmatospirillum siberiense]